MLGAPSGKLVVSFFFLRLTLLFRPGLCRRRTRQTTSGASANVQQYAHGAGRPLAIRNRLQECYVSPRALRALYPRVPR